MNRQHTALDERQLGIRAGIVTRAFAIVLGAAWLNGALVDHWRAWGSATDQALTQLWLALALVTVPAIWRGAYFRNRKDRRTLTILTATVAVMTGATTLLKAAVGGLRIWRDGHAGPDYQITLMGGYFTLVAITLLARWLADRRAPVDED